MIIEPGLTAVVTGAASGIGSGIVERALELGMRVVLADVEQDALDQATNTWSQRYAGHVAGVVADVSKVDDWRRLKQAADDAFGSVDIVFNNAGVSLPPRRVWDLSLEDWQWLIDVNLWGTVYGLHTFLPEMVARDSGYIVNTASMSGLLPAPRMAPYAATKHAVVGLSETTFRDLAASGSKVGVSVICAGRVETRIFQAARNRDAKYGRGPDAVPRTLSAEQLASQIQPYDVGVLAFDAIEKGQFWILTHPGLFADAVRARAAGAADQANPDDRSADPWISLAQ